jgi:hypothetical protein
VLDVRKAAEGAFREVENPAKAAGAPPDCRAASPTDTKETEMATEYVEICVRKYDHQDPDTGSSGEFIVCTALDSITLGGRSCRETQKERDLVAVRVHGVHEGWIPLSYADALREKMGLKEN